MDMADWELLLKQLEDTLALGTLLRIRVPSNQKQPCEGDAAKEPVRVSVSKLLDGGRGLWVKILCFYLREICIGCGRWRMNGRAYVDYLPESRSIQYNVYMKQNAYQYC